MNIIMHCGGIPFDGNTIKEKSLGGSETAAYYMARELVKLQHDVILFTNSINEGVFDGVQYAYSGEVSQQFPLGIRFEEFASTVPSDVLIIQRHPLAFNKPYASKLNILWLHDLALHRQTQYIANQAIRIDGYFVVSEYHKKQVCAVYGLNPDYVFPVKNGVDLELFDSLQDTKNFKKNLGLEGKKILTYSSRPERGLENLVGENGIMERLLKRAPEYHLVVCGYDNTTPQMEAYYNMLWERCEKLPNVTNVGALSKWKLAKLMRHAFYHVYPTEFEEVSCITVMECAAAELPMLASDVGAISETSRNSGTYLIPLKDGKADIGQFTALLTGGMPAEFRAQLCGRQKNKRKDYSWHTSALGFNLAIHRCKSLAVKSTSSILKHCIRTSDIHALHECLYTFAPNNITLAAQKEFEQCYDFYLKDNFKDHYAQYYEYEKDRGVKYGPEQLDGNNRFETVSGIIEMVSGRVLDYGCAHGHYTINLAKRFPNIHFVGVDINQRNINTAKKWAKDDDVKNVSFICSSYPDYFPDETLFDAVIAAEVLEHVGDVNEALRNLHSYLKPNGLMIWTTPYGPWEAIGYKEHHPYRAHLYHFERADIEQMVAHFDNFKIIVAPSGSTPQGEIIGSYVTLYNVADQSITAKEYKKESSIIPAKQTLTLCLLVKDCPDTLRRCLESVCDVVDEYIIGVDETSIKGTKDAIDELFLSNKFLYSTRKIIDVKSPLEIGFNNARNQLLEHCNGDWILWLDSDEFINDQVLLHKLLRNNMFVSYAVEQHHMSFNPPGTLKIDKPTKLFRNNLGIKFHGLVHEHPEMIPGEGIPFTCAVPLTVVHVGYDNEEIRRGRFRRNLSLLARERELNPNRPLNNFLWIRDLAQMNQYEIEKTNQLSETIIDRARQCVDEWEILVKKDVRLALEALPFYSACVRTLNNSGFDVGLTFDCSKDSGGVRLNEVEPVEGRFYSKKHLNMFLDKLVELRVKDYESKYY